MSYLSESFWREGLNMDSSIFSDDDSLDWRWPASSPRRCDRESYGILGMDHSTHRNYAAQPTSCSCSCSSSNMEELFFYCTEELGSESTSGVGNNLHRYKKEYMSSSTPQASSSGRCTYEDYNWAFKQQACAASSSCIKSTSCNLEFEDHHSSSRRISSHAHIFHANAPHHHHHCHTTSGGSNRAFPPPIASLLTDRPLMRSFKSNGRFVLKKVANVSRSLFRSTRENGHLRLDLLSCSFDCLESQYGVLFPASASMSSALQDVSSAEGISSSGFQHDYDSDMGDIPFSYHFLRSPSPYNTILHHKPTLDYEALCPPSKLQAIAMLMHPKGQCIPTVEKSISTPSTSLQAEHLIKGQTGKNTAMVQSRPHFFALLKLLPSGLGLIVFEIGKLKGRDHVTMYGMYIPKDFGFECGRASVSPSHHYRTTQCVVSSEDPKGRLSPFEDCKRDGYMKGVFSQHPLF